MATPEGIDPALLKAARAEVTETRAKLEQLDEHSLDVLFRKARSHHTWLDRPVTDEDIHRLYDVFKWGPTSTNGNPARFVFVRSEEQKEKLSTCVAAGNVQKVLSSPLIAIVAYDTNFWEHMPFLFAHVDMTGRYRGNPEYTETTAFRNSSLQGAYMMLAARALGFDIGALSGFNNAAVDEVFFAGTTLKSNFLCNIGYADVDGLFPRLPRLAFEDACQIL